MMRVLTLNLGVPRNDVTYPFLGAHDDAVYTRIWVGLLSEGRDVAVRQDCCIKGIDTFPRSASSVSPVEQGER